jgi:outer membrane murein-binding lipoprotein Lpp
MRWRNAWLTVCSALVLAGCGGSDNTFTTTQQRTTTTSVPTIQSAVAEQLAGQSDEIARRLDAGDPCGAAHAADRLRNELTAAINAGSIPALYLEDLSSSVNELQAQLACNPPAAEDNGKGKSRDKEKKKKKHDGDEQD